ncbi:MAG: glycoside hydrolase family 2 TIM barrel-domain containing protein [Clostridia bacterium]
MRTYLNFDWQFAKNSDFTNSQVVNIPHSNCILPISYASELDYQFVSYYRNTFNVEAISNVLLTFTAVAHKANVYVNGKFVGTHNCGYTAFTFNITNYVAIGQNLVTVEVDSRENLNFAPFGNVIDYLTYGGMYGEVYLDELNEYYIEDVFVNGYATSSPFNFNAEITLNKYCSKLSLLCRVIEKEEVKLNYLEQVKEKVSVIFAKLDEAKLWDVDNPNLYQLSVELLLDGKVIDSKNLSFGFRDCKFTKEGFFLNGKKIKLRGLNRHQSYAYVGYAMPKRAQEQDAKFLKEELCVNIVRTSHYPQSQYFLDECDRLGLLVFTEIPGWQHIGDKQWQAQSINHVKEMVMQYRNHPSIICYGVRINESFDEDEFYSQTNKVARELDCSRQTAGVRYIANSSDLEDIYSYNDFVFKGDNSPVRKKSKVYSGAKPMLITEFNGHMYPTKSYDNEKHRVEHANRHYKVIKAYYYAKHLAGGIGWCMSDYNTHKQFGSGDGICHHGVADIFRNAKLAGAVYASFGKKPRLEVSSSMDKGEWERGYLDKVYAYTNADSVKLYLNNQFVKEFFAQKDDNMTGKAIVIDDFIGNLIQNNEKFSLSSSNATKKCINYALSHGDSSFPPIILLKMLFVKLREKVSFKKLFEIGQKYATGWGSDSASYKFEAIKDGEVVQTVIKEPVTTVDLAIDVNATTLVHGQTYDVANIRFRAVDQNNNTLPYCFEPLTLKTQGSIELIGDSVVTLLGGMSGTYLKTTSKGNGKLIINAFDKTYTLDFNIE